MAAYDLGAVLWPDTAQGRIPQGAIQVNLDNPLSKGLQIAYSPASGLLNLVDGRGFTQTGLTDAVNLKGRAIKNNATATSNISTRVISGQTDLTVLFIGSRDSSTTTTGVGKVQDVVHTSVTALETNRWELNLGNGFGAVGDVDKPRFSQNSGGSATGLEMMIDGVLQSGCNPAPTVLVNKKIYSIICAGRGMQGDSAVALLGSVSGNQYAADATANVVLVWNRYLSQDERISVTENIGQLLSFSSPALMWAPTVVGGSGAVLASSANANPSASAALTTAINLAATASANPSAAATLTTVIALAASAGATPAASASLTTQIALQSSAAASPTSTATLTAPGQAMAASASATPSSSAVLTTGIALQSSASASPSASAILTAPGQGLASSASASPGGSASLTTGISLSSANSAAAQATATLLTVIRLSSSAQAQTGGSAALSTGTAAWTASNTAQCIASANLTTQILMASSATAKTGGAASLLTLLLQIDPRYIAKADARPFAVAMAARSFTIADQRNFNVASDLRTFKVIAT